MAIGLILGAFRRTMGQVGDPRFRRVLFTGVALTFALLVAVFAAFLLAIQWFVGPEATLPLIGEVQWLDDLLSVTTFLVMIFMSAFLMIPVASAITSMFLDDVAQAVEDRHYPGLPQVARQPFGEALRDSLNFLGILIGANLLALVAYVLFPPFAPFIFIGMNGWLLGLEYFTLAAMRRVGRDEARRLRARHRMTIWAGGVLMALPLVVPVLNLVVPILGAATFTHIFHALKSR